MCRKVLIKKSSYFCSKGLQFRDKSFAINQFCFCSGKVAKNGRFFVTSKAISIGWKIFFISLSFTGPRTKKSNSYFYLFLILWRSVSFEDGKSWMSSVGIVKGEGKVVFNLNSELGPLYEIVFYEPLFIALVDIEKKKNFRNLAWINFK